MITGQQLEEWGKDAPPNSAAGAYYRAKNTTPPPESAGKPQIRIRKKREPNVTEQRFATYANALWKPEFCIYEAITLRLPSLTAYTPDWWMRTNLRTGIFDVLVECKGAHMGHSKRSIHAFKEAIQAFPQFHFIFAQWTDGEWRFEGTSGILELLKP